MSIATAVCACVCLCGHEIFMLGYEELISWWGESQLICDDICVYIMYIEHKSPESAYIC